MSTDDCFCQEQVRQNPSPNCSYSQSSRSSAVTVSLGSCRLRVAKQHLLQRVSAQAEPQGLERDDLLGRDVPEVDLWPEMLDEPGLRRLRGRLPDEVVEVDRMGDLVDQAGAHLAAQAEAARGAALARLGHDLPGAGLELLLDPQHPLVGRKNNLGALGDDLGEDGKIAREG